MLRAVVNCIMRDAIGRVVVRKFAYLRNQLARQLRGPRRASVKT
jgi:hypothetical protein